MSQDQLSARTDLKRRKVNERILAVKSAKPLLRSTFQNVHNFEHISILFFPTKDIYGIHGNQVYIPKKSIAYELLIHL